MAISMGLGKLADPNLIFKRKFRWTLAIQPYCGNVIIPPYFVKVASRPNITIEETEINFLNAKMFIPGKATWETITVTFMDVAAAGVAGANQGILPLYSWLASTFNFTEKNSYTQSSQIGSPGRGGYSADGNLILYDGCGTPIEGWKLQNMFPQSINFGDLDYTSSEECTVEVTLRFNQAYYVPSTCVGEFAVCCGGCTTNTTFPVTPISPNGFYTGLAPVA